MGSDSKSKRRDSGTAEVQQVPFLTLTNWVRAAAQFGIPIESLFKEAGVETDVIHPETATVHPESIWHLMQICVADAQSKAHSARASVPHFPFVLGESFAFEYLSDVDTFLTTSPTLRAALRVFDWIHALINPQLDIQLVETGDMAELVLALRPLPNQRQLPGAEHYFVEALFAAVLKFARLLLGDPPPFTRLDFAHAAPPYAALYETFFRLPVRFEQARNQVVFERQLLDRPLKGAFPSLNLQAEQRVEHRLAQMPKTGELVAALEQAWQQHPELLARNIGHMAAHLQMHERSLQRRLRALGHSYIELQGQYKYRMACLWLSDPGLSIETISENLGFADRRSFTEAFKRWSGRSPSKYRKTAGFP